ncbi:MAG TPA: site-2 protease family protein [Actinomycetota bacterium]
MFGRSFRIATIRGIPVNVDSSWIWIAVLAVYSLWARFDARFPDLGSGVALLYGVAGAGLFFGSVFGHELAHAVTARLAGIRVEGITLVFFGGFTAARSEERGAGPAFAISALGPATSFALSGLFWGLSRITEGPGGPLPALFGYIGWVNLFMGVFNVLPGLPLDGGRMVQAGVWRIAGNRDLGTRVAARAGMGLGVLLFGVAILMVVRQDLFGALWLAIIGMFIFQGARASEEQIGLARRLAAGTVADAMDPPPPAVPAELTLSETLDRYLRGHEEEAFPVVERGKVIGMISFSSASELGASDPLRPARDAVIPLDQVLVAHPDESLQEVSARLGRRLAALVLDDGELVGAITGGGVYRWAASRAR